MDETVAHRSEAECGRWRSITALKFSSPCHCVGRDSREQRGLIATLHRRDEDEDERHDEHDERRRRARGRPARLASNHLLIVASSFRRMNQLSGKTEDHHEHEQHDVAGRRQAVEPGLVLLVHRRGDDVSRETRSAAGHRPDQIEATKSAHERQQDHRERRRLAERHDHVSEPIPTVATVNCDRLVQLGRDRQNSCDEDDERQPTPCHTSTNATTAGRCAGRSATSVRRSRRHRAPG